MPKVLLAVTSYGGPFYGEGKTTGLYASEAIHPFEVFKSKGFDVQFVSLDGTYAYDPHSISHDGMDGDARAIYLNEHSDYNMTLKNIKKISEVDPSEYDIFFAAGGHGTCIDFSKYSDLVAAAEKIYAKGGIIAAVCHGPVIFNTMKDTATGKPLIEGKSITGFTDQGEKDMGVMDFLEKNNHITIESMAKRLNANYSPPPSPWADYSITDGRIVTGVNPASATSTAQKAIQVLN